MSLPNFFIAGVPNSGTTSLHFYLHQHPQVYMSPIKEPTFFGAEDALRGQYGDDVRRQVVRDHDAVRQYVGGGGGGGGALEWEDYLKLFGGVRDEIAVGESSVRYFRLAAAAGTIRSRLPDARLIFMLRDPVDRVHSRYLGNGWRDAHLAFGDWFRAARAPGSLWEPVIDGGRYATHLQRFLAVFPREQMRLYLYDDYRADPQAVLRDIFAFLRVDPSLPIDMSHRHNEAVVPRSTTLQRLRHRVFGTGPAPQWLPGTARRALRRLYYRRPPHVAMPAADRQLVVDYYRDEVVRTGDLIGRDLSAWLRC
jgi:Sulfotransferase family